MRARQHCTKSPASNITILLLEKLVPRWTVVHRPPPPPWQCQKKRRTTAIPRSGRAPSHKWRPFELMNRIVTSDESETVAHRPGIFPVVTRSQHHHLHLKQSEKRNIAACHLTGGQLQDTKHNYSSWHSRHPWECRTLTTRHKSHRIRRPVRRQGHLPPDATSKSNDEKKEEQGQIFSDVMQSPPWKLHLKKALGHPTTG
jgi:hypothetical protein